jgi:PTS system nitrogen regulatory IIA component
MKLSDVIDISHVKNDIEIHSKKRALEELSKLIAEDQPQLNASNIFDSLIARERLGSTGLGHGIAIPHCRIKNCNKTTGAFIKLESGIDFDAIDNEPVDMMFALAVPEESSDEHLQILAMLASMFKDENVRQKLRQAETVTELYHILTEQHSSE